MSFQLVNIAIPYISRQVSDIWNTTVLFERGKYYHIRASSGKGKSSLIHTLYGLQQKYEGQLQFNGTDCKGLSINQWCEIRSRHLSIVFQDLRLFEEHTALQNLLIKNELTGFTSESIIREYANRLGITHTLDRLVNTLSYGERQRVAIIRALLQPMDCLLLDEPFSHLDNENIQLAASLILESVKKSGATLIVCDLESDQHFPYHQNFLL
ncbi:MAG: ATP-binding cassette domain-containing protein [Bacteroidetes bacterium]|nr:ATP-binding cassette domain-containing protein [Bacteroidota bacterium]MBK8145009.1 ATP-binding cassette domain-containing protein [Bacteroidota bacterium]MBP6316290.1 ATP-binding cassette domain-containing protein [Chitinophagaceae bacterium]